MRTAKYNDYKLLSVAMLILLVIVGLAIYFAFSMLPSHDHVADSWVTVDPTCETAGSRYKVCTKCGEKFDNEELPATGHNMVTKKENEKDHTETEGGSFEQVVYCEDCGTVDRRETVWVGQQHTPEVFETRENVVEATCEKSGSYVLVKTCAACGVVISSETIVEEATGHDYEWEVAYDNATKTYSLNAVCGKDGSEISIHQNDPNVDFSVVGDETVASCCLIRYIVSCTYNGERIQEYYDCIPHENHVIEYYEDKDSLYNPQPVYVTLPDPYLDPIYGYYYNIDETPYITPYNVGNSVWNEYGFSYGAFKCHACEEHGCTACVENGHYIIVKIYSAKYDTRLNNDEKTEI